MANNGGNRSSTLGRNESLREDLLEVLHGGLSQHRPRAIPLEYIHAGTRGERLPPGALEQREEGRLVHVPERIAVVGVHRHLDRGTHHSTLPCARG